MKVEKENQFWTERKSVNMKWCYSLLVAFAFFMVISAHKQIEDNVDLVEPEGKEHSSKKYSKDYQTSHHHGNHKHKKHSTQDHKQAESRPKAAPLEIPEPEIQLQSDLETNKKAIDAKNQKAQVEDLHLQDLTYEENLKKDKKGRKNHHGSQEAEVLEKHKKKEPKLFDERERKHGVEEKVIEDSFEPLQDKRSSGGENKKNKSNKKSKNGKKKAHEKNNKDKGKKYKDGKKNKNKDKQNKDKKKW